MSALAKTGSSSARSRRRSHSPPPKSTAESRKPAAIRAPGRAAPPRSSSGRGRSRRAPAPARRPARSSALRSSIPAIRPVVRGRPAAAVPREKLRRAAPATLERRAAMAPRGFLRRLFRPARGLEPNASAKEGRASGVGPSGMGAATGSAARHSPWTFTAGAADPASCASRLSIRLRSTRTLRLAPTALASATIGPTSTQSTARTPRTTSPSKSLPHRHGRLIHSPNSHRRVGSGCRGAGGLPLPGLCERVPAKPDRGGNPRPMPRRYSPRRDRAFCFRTEAPGDGRSR